MKDFSTLNQTFYFFPFVETRGRFLFLYLVFVASTEKLLIQMHIKGKCPEKALLLTKLKMQSLYEYTQIDLIILIISFDYRATDH